VSTVNVSISFESLIEAVTSLNLEQQRELVEILEDKIFEAEEDEMENDPKVLAEIEEARAAYKRGDYVTIEEYIASRRDRQPE